MMAQDNRVRQERLRLLQSSFEEVREGMPSLPEEEVHAVLGRALPQWEFTEGKLIREVQFRNFREALGFINLVGALAERFQHHPDLYLYQYNRVRITLWTHVAGGVTRNDLLLAAHIETLLDT